MNAMHQHIQNQQNQACRLVHVLEAIGALDNEGIAQSAVTALIGVAIDLAHDINDQLDCTALPPTDRVVEVVPSVSPVMALFRQWEVALAEETRLHNDRPISERDDAIVDAAGDRRQAIEDQMIAEKSLSAQDVLAKIASWTLYGEFTFDHSDQRLAPVWDEIRALTHSRPVAA